MYKVNLHTHSAYQQLFVLLKLKVQVIHTGWKIVVMRVAAKHYCTFYTCIAGNITPSTTANHTIIN